MVQCTLSTSTGVQHQYLVCALTIVAVLQYKQVVYTESTHNQRSKYVHKYINKDLSRLLSYYYTNSQHLSTP